jgi:hypothetical protein
MMAINCNYVDMVQPSLEHGAQPNSVDKELNTSLIKAVAIRSDELVHLGAHVEYYQPGGNLDASRSHRDTYPEGLVRGWTG